MAGGCASPLRHIRSLQHMLGVCAAPYRTLPKPQLAQRLCCAPPLVPIACISHLGLTAVLIAQFTVRALTSARGPRALQGLAQPPVAISAAN